jgi:hypothetical protein
MIISLSLLPAIFISYIFYAKEISPPLLLFLILGGITYIVYWGIFAKPDKAIYAFLALWIFFPKSIRKIPLLGIAEDLSGGVFTIVEAFAILSIVVAIVKCKKRWRILNVPKSQKRFYLLLLAATVFSFISSLALQWIGYFPSIDIRFEKQFIHLLEPIYALIFLYGLMAFIKEKHQVETLLKIVVLGGVSIGAQAVVFFHLKKFTFFNPWVLNEVGRFQSLQFNSFGAVGVFSIITICCAMYFFLCRKNRIILIISITMMFVSITATLERAPFAGAITSLAILLWVVGNQKFKAIYLATGIFFLIVVITADFNALFFKTASFLGMGMRFDYHIIDFSSRIDLGLKGLSVAIFSFPFGVGTGQTQAFIGTYFSDFFYVASTYVSGSHNTFISFIAEHGFLGIMTLFYFIYLISHNIALLKNKFKHTNFQNRRNISAYFAIYAIFIGVSIFYFFDATPKFYLLYLMFFHMTFLGQKFFTSRTYKPKNDIGIQVSDL